MNCNRWLICLGLLAPVTAGCAENAGPAPGAPASDEVQIDTPERRVDVDAGRGGVEVDVEGQDAATRDRGVGVDVDAGGVDVNVQGDGEIVERIRERREERREERQLEQ